MLERVLPLTIAILPMTGLTLAQQIPSTGTAPESFSRWWLATPPAAAVAALLVAFAFYRKMLSADEGTARMKEIAAAVREGAMAYLKTQYRAVALVFVALFIVLGVMAGYGLQTPLVPIAFLTGGFFSVLTGFLGMRTATSASARTANAARSTLNGGLRVAFRSGAVMGLSVVGFGLLMIWVWYMILDRIVYTPEHMRAGWSFLVSAGFPADEKLLQVTNSMLGFGIGASLAALFARVGGGIYTKSADVGADLVGKVEAGIPEDDPRNPATIADNVGDNVGDVAGMGADLYESYCNSILATSALGASLPIAGHSLAGESAVVLPMIVAAMGVLVSILGTLLVYTGEDPSMGALMRALNRGTNSAAVLIVGTLAAFAATRVLGMDWGLFFAIVSGLVAGVVIGYSTSYYTSDEYAPTRGIAEQAETGPATVIIAGLSVGMLSSAIPVITVIVSILLSYGLAGGFGNPSDGLYGIAFSAVGMLATLGVTLATDAYGPIADNAGGNAEMSGLPPEVRDRTDALDMLGNTTAAMGKGFAIGSAALTALALIGAYIMGVVFWSRQLGVNPQEVRGDLRLTNPLLIAGLFLGAMVAVVFVALTMKAVGRAAGGMVDEVRRQFREIAGIMEGTAKPDYHRCVAIATRAAQREMILPSSLAVIVPVATGLVLGVPGLLGLLMGSLAAGFSLACMLNNAGGAWDNAKKFVEKGNLGGKYLKNAQGQYVDPDGNVVTDRSKAKNPIHGATVIGDTVGDPCKDTSGPSLNILLKLMSIVAVIFTPITVKYAPVVQHVLFGK